MKSASVIAFQAVVMFILIFVGYFLYKKKLMGEEATRQLSNITISIINPIVIFNSYQTEFNRDMLHGLLCAMALALAAQGILVIASHIAVRKGNENSPIERFAFAYSNCAFMGIPLVEAVFGSGGVFFLTAYITMFNIFMWTHGVFVMGSKKGGVKQLAKVLLSPSMLAIALGLITFFTGLRLPQIIQLPLDYLGSTNTPLAMLVSGATIAKAGLFAGFKQRRVYYVQMFKLIIIPVLLSALFVPLRIFGISGTVINVVLIAAAAPTASATIMFSYKYGHDAEYAAHHFTVSTILSILTMPLILLVAELMTALLVP